MLINTNQGLTCVMVKKTKNTFLVITVSYIHRMRSPFISVERKIYTKIIVRYIKIVECLPSCKMIKHYIGGDCENISFFCLLYFHRCNRV